MENLPNKTPIESRWVRLSHEDYLAKGNFLSSTDCKRLLRSPEYFMDCRLNPPEPTKAMELGTLIHSAVLEGETFFRNAVKAPSFDKRTKAGKEGHAEFISSLTGSQKAVDAEDYEVIERIYERLNKHPVVKGMFTTGKREISGFANESTHGIASKIRPDFMIAHEGIIMDLKTTTDASRDEFERQIWQYHYEVSAYKYLHLASIIERHEFETYFYLAVEKVRPYSVALYRADPAQLEAGEFLYKKSLRKYVEALEKKEWQGYQTEAEWIGLPAYALNKVSMERELEEVKVSA